MRAVGTVDCVDKIAGDDATGGCISVLCTSAGSSGIIERLVVVLAAEDETEAF